MDLAQLREIFGKKSWPMEKFDRGGWHFERVGKIGGRSSWRVMRSFTAIGWQKFFEVDRNSD